MYAATAANADAFGAIAKESDLPLAIKADSVEALVGLSDKLTGMGLKDLVLDQTTRYCAPDRQPTACCKRGRNL